MIKVISSTERQGKFDPLHNKVQFHEGVFGGGEIAVNIMTLYTKWVQKFITETSSSTLYFDLRNSANENV